MVSNSDLILATLDSWYVMSEEVILISKKDY